MKAADEAEKELGIDHQDPDPSGYCRYYEIKGANQKRYMTPTDISRFRNHNDDARDRLRQKTLGYYAAQDIAYGKDHNNKDAMRIAIREIKEGQQSKRDMEERAASKRSSLKSVKKI